MKGQRREVKEGNRTIIQEPGRTIVKDGNRTIIKHNESDRFRINAKNVIVTNRGRDQVTTVIKSDGSRIITVTNDDGSLLRRSLRGVNGREVILIDNQRRGGPRRGPGGAIIAGGIAAGLGFGAFIALPPPRISIARERYIVDDIADESLLYDTFIAPPVDTIERAYTLDEIRYSPTVRDRVRRVDVDTVTFETGSWEVTPDQAGRLEPVANAIRRAIEQNPTAIFLIEGHTDAVGADEDNLSLSDRRAESVALVLSEQFGVPAENLTTQGYGEQQLKVQTDGAERQNRRVTVRNISSLLNGQASAAPPPR